MDRGAFLSLSLRGIVLPAPPTRSLLCLCTASTVVVVVVVPRGRGNRWTRIVNLADSLAWPTIRFKACLRGHWTRPWTYFGFCDEPPD